ncbi:pentapeptide repeat-containing protein [Nocardioides sp. Bht2]|uniref:pentapeptide repeat-containing protein n=1 Tax=Nocardioides sp. Bht2 TaxID=3392297 RepID=UPI0039B42F2B
MPWWIDAVVAVTAVLLLLLTSLYLVGSWYTGDWSLRTPKGKIPWSDFTRVATPAVTLVVAVVAAVLAGHGHAARLKELEMTRDANKVDTYSRSVEQLGSDQVSTRLGGIYSLQRLALTSSEESTTVDQVLSAHLRLVFGRLAGDYAIIEEWEARTGGPNDPWDSPPAPPSGVPRESSMAEASAALHVLGVLNQTYPESTRFNLRNLQWPGAAWPHGLVANGIKAPYSHAWGEELAGAQLNDADLSTSELSKVKLQGASLRHTSLRDARLENANLAGADLEGADLEGALIDLATYNKFATKELRGWARDDKGKLRRKARNQIGFRVDPTRRGSASATSPRPLG